MCINFVDGEGNELIPGQHLGAIPKPGDVIDWATGSFKVQDGPHRYRRFTTPIIRWVLSIPVLPVESKPT
jgi:hypothetical protein